MGIYVCTVVSLSSFSTSATNAFSSSIVHPRTRVNSARLSPKTFRAMFSYCRTCQILLETGRDVGSIWYSPSTFLFICQYSNNESGLFMRRTKLLHFRIFRPSIQRPLVLHLNNVLKPSGNHLFFVLFRTVHDTTKPDRCFKDFVTPFLHSWIWTCGIVIWSKGDGKIR